MSQQELLTHVICTLQDLGIEYMLSGSHASSVQGESRVTHDIDLVVDLSAGHVQSILKAFPSQRFYVSESAVTDAIRLKRMFNVLEVTTGEKVDFWVLTDGLFDRTRFSRRVKVDLGETIADVSSPEDTILMKLNWAKQSGGSAKQLGDVVHVYELQAELLDMEYIAKWTKELGVVDLWERVVAEAEPFNPDASE